MVGITCLQPLSHPQPIPCHAMLDNRIAWLPTPFHVHYTITRQHNVKLNRIVKDWNSLQKALLATDSLKAFKTWVVSVEHHRPY